MHFQNHPISSHHQYFSTPARHQAHLCHFVTLAHQSSNKTRHPERENLPKCTFQWQVGWQAAPIHFSSPNSYQAGGTGHFLRSLFPLPGSFVIVHTFSSQTRVSACWKPSWGRGWTALQTCSQSLNSDAEEGWALMAVSQRNLAVTTCGTRISSIGSKALVKILFLNPNLTFSTYTNP